MNLIKLLVLAHVAVALLSCYYYFFLLNRQHITAVQNSSDYDFFYFVQTWPGSVHPTTRAGVPKNFAIHGLWPQFNNGTYPKTCPAPDPFDVKKVANIRKKLDKEWPTLLPNSTDEQFWKYEWEKHGNCSVSVLDQYKYFNANLLLKDKTRVFQTLKDNGINPDDKNHSLRLIQKTLKDKVKFTPLIKCTTNGSDPTPEFYEVYFCVEPKGANFMECPPQAVQEFNRTARCGGDKSYIKYPIYNPHDQHVLNINEESTFETSDIL